MAGEDNKAIREAVSEFLAALRDKKDWRRWCVPIVTRPPIPQFQKCVAVADADTRAGFIIDRVPRITGEDAEKMRAVDVRLLETGSLAWLAGSFLVRKENEEKPWLVDAASWMPLLAVKRWK